VEVEEDSKELLRYVASLVASKVVDYIIDRLKGRRIRDIDVTVRILDYEKLNFEIDVNIETDLLVKDEMLREVADSAVEYGFQILDKVINHILKRNFKVSKDEIERIIKQFSRTNTNNNP